MTSLFSLNYPLQSLCWPKANKLVKNVLLMAAGVIILAFASQLSIPLKPVPLTFQSAAVLMIALVYGARLGSATILAYLAVGAVGIPVFADMTSGLGILFLDPSSGYFLGFVFATLLTGYLTEHGWGKHFISAFAAALAGCAVIFYLGVTVLSHYVGWSQAFDLGAKPFLTTELIKLVIIAAIAPRFWKTRHTDADRI